MKKSKIIVPALGIILLSTVASVTGTVAWFTANTKYDTKVSTFEVGRLVGDLTCKLTAGVGTTITTDASNKEVVSLKTKVDSTDYVSILGDASMANKDGTFYSVAEGDRNVSANTEINKYTVVDSSYRNIKGEMASADYQNADNAASLYFYAVSWSMQFTYQFGSTTNTQNLYLNFTTAKGTVSQGADVTTRNNDGTGDSSKAFRIAFVSGDNLAVWAPFNSDVGSHVTYTGDTAPDNTTSTQAWNVDTTVKTAVQNNASDVLIGQIANTDGPQTSASTTVTCYAWFEGTDNTNIINTTKIQKFAATLGFYTESAS